jgi:hypothetical protein
MVNLLRADWLGKPDVASDTDPVATADNLDLSPEEVRRYFPHAAG